MPGYGSKRDAPPAVDAGSVRLRFDTDTIQFGTGEPRPLHDAKAKNALPAGVTATWLWAAGETAFVLASDGAVYLYADGKPSQPPIRGVQPSGGVGVSGGQVVIHEHALSRLTAMDGLNHRTTRGRARHDEPCHPDDVLEQQRGHEPDASSA